MKKRKCTHCKGRIDGFPGNIRFPHDGFKFIAVRTEYECNDCVKANVIDIFLRNNSHFGKPLVRLEDNLVVVDWEWYMELQKRDILTTSTLMDIMVLSREMNGNWAIICDGVSLCPSTTSMQLYFTSKHHALGYAGAVYGDSKGPIFIYNISDVTPLHPSLGDKPGA